MNKFELFAARVSALILVAGLASVGGAIAGEDPDPVNPRDILLKTLTIPTPVQVGALYRIIHEDHQGRTKERLAVYFFGRSPNDPQDQRNLIYFLEPADLKGNASLTANYMATGQAYSSKSWVYDPLVGQVRLNSIANWRNRRFGSSLIVFDSLHHDLDWYVPKLAGEESIGGKTAYKLEITFSDPLISERSGYHRLVSWIDQATYFTLRAEWYNLKNEKVKTIENQLRDFGEFQMVDGVKAVLHRGDGKNETTTIKIDQFVFDLGLDFESFFNKRTLEREIQPQLRQKILQAK